MSPLRQRKLVALQSVWDLEVGGLYRGGGRKIILIGGGGGGGGGGAHCYYENILGPCAPVVSPLLLYK